MSSGSLRVVRTKHGQDYWFLNGRRISATEAKAMQTQSVRSKKATMANPASVYCQKHGGRSTMRTDVNGQYGVCVFSDGSECDEWKFMRGECKPGDSNKTITRSTSRARYRR